MAHSISALAQAGASSQRAKTVNSRGKVMSDPIGFQRQGERRLILLGPGMYRYEELSQKTPFFNRRQG